MADDNFSWWQFLAYPVFAAFGGLMGYLMRAVDSGHEIRYTRALLEAMSAGFVGVLVTLACLAMDLNPLWSGVIVGVSGWLGAQASIRMLETLIYKRLGITREDTAVRKEMKE